MEIALGNDAKGADGGEHPALRPVDLVNAIALSYRPPLTPARQVEILREDISRVAIVHMIAVTGSATAAAARIATVAAVAVITRSRIESVPHWSSLLPPDVHIRPRARAVHFPEYGQGVVWQQSIVGLRRVLSGVAENVMARLSVRYQAIRRGRGAPLPAE
jgi:hypothetical protein